jgi:putative oxidoreductase
MSGLVARLSAWQPRMLAVLRIVTGLLFVEHGTVKLLDFPHGAPPGPQHPMTLFWIAGVIELVAGALVTLGLFTRLAAFVASGEMAIAYWTVHARQGLYPAANMGDAAALFCFVFLYLVFAGAGAWSVDEAMAARTAAAD